MREEIVKGIEVDRERGMCTKLFICGKGEINTKGVQKQSLADSQLWMTLSL